MNKTIMRALGLGDMVDKVENSVCPLCDETINEDMFRDNLSRKEFKISGMCQVCQDSIFGVEE